MLGKCLQCGKENSVRKGRKFCSTSCYGDSKLGKPSGAMWSEESRERLSKRYAGKGNPAYGKPAWSRGKKRPEMTGAKHPNYKGGWVQDGYRYICVGGKQKAKHRYKMEQHIGRELSNDEVVHHKNGDRMDNRLENLEIMSKAEHMDKHRREILKGGKREEL